ncbi:MAG: hypothetical protein HXX14_07375 [Bacteroidetes bacterium]|nr:hypothetical protein [Bacteroidota bacterium]
MYKTFFLISILIASCTKLVLSQTKYNHQNNFADRSVQLAINWPTFMAQHDLIWDELPLQWNEGAFVGNGQVGMMVYATLKDNQIDFHIGRQDVTDHRKAPNLKTSQGVEGAGVMFDYPRLDIGKFALRPAGKILSGTFRQDLWNAEIRATIITSLGTISFRALTPYNQMVNIVEVTSTEKNKGIAAPYQWVFKAGNPASPRAIALPNLKESKEYITNPKPVILKQKETTVCVQSLLAGGDYATAWIEKQGKHNGKSTLYISTANEVPASGVSAKVAQQTINDVSKQPMASIVQAHRNWWQKYYQQSFLSIPDGRLESFYWIQLYKLATCSRVDGPAIDLFGPFFRTSQWPGLWWNLNIELTYWPIYASNHLALGENLISLIDRQFDALLKTFEGPKLGDFAWIMHNYWLQYRYAGDWKSVQEKWAPKAMKIAAAFEKMQVKNAQGKIELLPMGSPEYKGFATFPNTTYNLAILRWLLNTLIETNEKANANKAEVVKWKQTLADLIPYPIDSNGLMIASNQSVDMSHRHFSHLLGLYPLFQLNPDSPEDRALVDKSVVHWHQIEGGKALAGYSYTGAASLYAALGRGNDANEILQHFLLGNIGISQLLSNTFYVEAGGKNPVIETPLSAAASTMEFLLQSWGGKVRVFPAVPDKWSDASFYQLRAQGGFLVSASRNMGKTVWVSVESLAGEPCILKVPDWNNAIQMNKGAEIKITNIGKGEFQLNLKAGQVVMLKETPDNAKVVVRPVVHPKEEQNLYGVKQGKQLPKDQSWPEPEYTY